jgi:Ca2+-dependent lipid-binding protein, contains C2 domain
LPPADKDGAADPYLIVSCAGARARTSERENTLNPGFFETVYLDVELPDLEQNVIEKELYTNKISWICPMELVFWCMMLTIMEKRKAKMIYWEECTSVSLQNGCISTVGISIML